MRSYAYSLFFLGHDEKGYIELLCEDLKETKFEFHHLKADIDDLPTQLSFLQGPVYIITDLDTIQDYEPVLAFLNAKFTNPITIGIGSMFKMGPLLRASACGVDHFVDKTRSKQIISKNIKQHLPIKESSSLPSEAKQTAKATIADRRHHAQFLADESEVMQHFLKSAHENKDANQWIIVGNPGAEFELATNEIVNIIGKTTSDLFYPELQGKQIPDNSVACYSPAHTYDPNNSPSQCTIRNIHNAEFQKDKHTDAAWIIMHLPDLLVRPSDKVQYFKRWIHKIKQMNKACSELEPLSNEQVHQLLCNNSITSFKALWYWMEQQVLNSHKERNTSKFNKVTNEHSYCVVQAIRQNYIKLVESAIPDENLGQILEELKFTNPL